MKKLYFRYGAMTSGKSMHLISVAENYRIQGKQCCVFNANEESKEEIYSRTGIKIKSNSIYDIEGVLDAFTSCILVDEAHFLLPSDVDYLREITILENIPIICYGLRTDFKGKLFSGSQRLMEIADSIEEIKTTCWFCEKKATMNLRLELSQDQILIENPGEKKYVPCCYSCWEMKK